MLCGRIVCMLKIKDEILKKFYIGCDFFLNF